MLGLVADPVLLVPEHVNVVAQCQRTHRIQLSGRHIASGRLVSRLHLHDPRHYVVRQNRLRYGHFSVRGVDHILLPWHYVARCVDGYRTLVYASLGAFTRSGCVAGGGHTNLLLAGTRVWRFDCVQLI